MQRVAILFMPKKYQPDAVFLQHVPLRRVHLFTTIQIVAIVAMFVIKYIDYVNMIFPLLIVALVFLRKGLFLFGLSYCIFEQLKQSTFSYSYIIPKSQ